MNVSDLIEELKKFPMHHPVLIDAQVTIKGIHAGNYVGPCVSVVAEIFDEDDGGGY